MRAKPNLKIFNTLLDIQVDRVCQTTTHVRAAQ